MRGRTVVVTGASRGIGRATALALGELGATVILVCRSRDAGMAVAREVQERGGAADLVLADFRSTPQARAAAREVLARHHRLDVLINNAAAVVEERRLTEERIEETLAINQVSPFVLTVELLDLLKASAPSRIVNLASDAHWRGWMHWHDLHFKSDYTPLRAYAQSKLANVLFTLELTRRLTGTGVTANAIHPGSVDTGLEDFEKGWKARLMRLIHPRISAEEAARHVVRLATAPELAGTSGAYFSGDRAVRPSGYGRDDGLARRIWTTSEQLLQRAAESGRAISA
jgi:NAD(P)-dependent dehydrogenase (short-subunit alcohol dehydrogenase family)